MSLLETILHVPNILLLVAALLCCVSIWALIGAAIHATAYRRKLNELEAHMRQAAGETSGGNHNH